MVGSVDLVALAIGGDRGPDGGDTGVPHGVPALTLGTAGGFVCCLGVGLAHCGFLLTGNRGDRGGERLAATGAYLADLVEIGRGDVLRCADRGALDRVAGRVRAPVRPPAPLVGAPRVR